MPSADIPDGPRHLSESALASTVGVHPFVGSTPTPIAISPSFPHLRPCQAELSGESATTSAHIFSCLRSVMVVSASHSTI